MRTFSNDDLLEVQQGSNPRLRMVATHYLCEGYVEDSRVLENIFHGWDTWGVEEAFPEFPMLSYLPVPATRVAECCQRASSMVKGRGLTDPVTRCAGKLIEQVVKLPAAELQIRFESIESTAAQSKIFFRVDLEALRERIALLSQDADSLAGQLDRSIATLTHNPGDPSAESEGLHSLEALRREHPQYLDLTSLLAHRPPDAGGQAASFHLALHSLTLLEGEGLEESLGRHLLDPRETVFVNTIEALVRIGTPEAAVAMFNQFSRAADTTRPWIARGLQRVRAPGLAEAIAALRGRTHDPALWLMLLVAEVRQFDPASSLRIAAELDRLATYSEPLDEAVHVYLRAVDSEAARAEIAAPFDNYLQRVNATK